MCNLVVVYVCLCCGLIQIFALYMSLIVSLMHFLIVFKKHHSWEEDIYNCYSRQVLSGEGLSDKTGSAEGGESQGL